jgi:hypothetical protein
MEDTAVRTVVHYLPIATSVFSLWFSTVLFRRYRERGGLHLFWWGLGALMYGVGTITESLTTLFGWSEPVFRAWYISGALLGGAPLAQGTVYLLLKKKTAHRLTAVLLTFVTVAATFVLLTPIDYSVVEPHRLTGAVMEWSRVRLFSPFINLYAATFLIGGAILSAVRYRKIEGMGNRVIGNVLIAVGALLPGIGGTFTRFGHVEVLYVTELIGILLIYAGFRFNVSTGPSPLGRRAPQLVEE